MCGCCTRKKFILVSVLLLLASSSLTLFVIIVYNNSSWSSSSSSLSPYLQTTTTATKTVHQKKRVLSLTGKEIVERAYNKTYKVLVDRCTSLPSIIVDDDDDNGSTRSVIVDQKKKRMTKERQLMNCIATLHEEKTQYEWWFETMIRDLASGGGGVWGTWHRQYLKGTTDRGNKSKIDVNFCNIEKVASTEWKRLQCNQIPNQTGTRCINQVGPPPPDAPRVVFLRDPLERFLSAFVDKCITNFRRERERHCEPREIYSPDGFVGIGRVISDSDNKKKKRRRLPPPILPPLVEELATHNRVFFDAYVDTIPLKWNVHFYPQAFYCDGGLFRTLSTDYDFVGRMYDDHFHPDLIEFGQKYGMEKDVAVAFRLRNDTIMASITNTKANNNILQVKATRSRGASKKIREYYTPRTLKRVLEYLSIDYVTLNLPIPDWVDEMLQSEEA